MQWQLLCHLTLQWELLCLVPPPAAIAVQLPVHDGLYDCLSFTEVRDGCPHGTRIGSWLREGPPGGQWGPPGAPPVPAVAAPLLRLLFGNRIGMDTTQVAFGARAKGDTAGGVGSGQRAAVLSLVLGCVAVVAGIAGASGCPRGGAPLGWEPF
jgi:hypothetical protein